MDFWIVFSLASGNEAWRAQGPTGTAATQAIPEGFGLVKVSQAAFVSSPLDLGLIRQLCETRIDAEAEQTRQRFLTPGAGQAMTYVRKEEEARAWTADNAAPTPFLTAEANARSMTIAALAAEVIARADAWTAIGAAIEGLRMGAKTAVEAGDTLGGIVAATQVDWAAVGA